MSIRQVDFHENEANKIPLNGKYDNEIPRKRIKRDLLPIDNIRKELIEIIRNAATAIFIGETGCGKSTQIPQMCLEVFNTPKDFICVTQPRKVAALSLALRVADEMGCHVGEEVGYKYRFADYTNENTRLIYLTDGLLLREALHDSSLIKYRIIIVDEAHERSIHTDVLLYVLKLAQKLRQQANLLPLKIFLMSATIHGEKFANYFEMAPIYYVKGRTYPVELHYAKSVSIGEDDYLYNSVATVLKLHKTEPISHGILVFLTGQEEIEAACKMIKQANGEKSQKLAPELGKIVAIPLYASLNQSAQALVFQHVPLNSRKVIFATNIAETSITIPDIRIVVDSGKIKQKTFISNSRVDILSVVNISKAQAIQRAGRAGREADGKCFRLYSNGDYEKFDEMPTPEILRSNLSSVLLDMVKMGMKKANNMKLIDPPDSSLIDVAVKELTMLKAIELSEKGRLSITPYGINLVAFPLEPIHANILLSAKREKCLEEALTVVSFLASETVFMISNNDFLSKNNVDLTDNNNEGYRKFDAAEGDHVRLLKIYRNYKTQLKNNKNNLKKWCQTNCLNKKRLENVCKIRAQLHELCKDQKMELRSCGADFTPLRRAICNGLFLNSCVYDRASGTYRLESKPSIVVKIHPSSCMARSGTVPAFVFTDLVQTTETYARDICPVDLDWLKLLKEAKK